MTGNLNNVNKEESTVIRRMLSYVFFSLLIVGAIFFESTLPPSIGGGSIPHVDKIAHFFAFGLLAFFLLNAIRPIQEVILWKHVLLVCVLVMFASAGNEYIQAFNATRQASFDDAIAGVLGGFFFTVIMKARQQSAGDVNAVEQEHSIKHDVFIQEFFQKLSVEQQQSFSDEQLLSVKLAFGARTRGIHAVDVRGTFKIFRWRYYYVFLTGRNKRSLSRLEEDAYRTVELLFIISFVAISTLFGLLALYLIKSAMGIDLIPGFSLGVWGWFKDAFVGI